MQTSDSRRRAPSRRSPGWYWLFPAVFLYWEFIFSFGTLSQTKGADFIFLTLFSLATGAVVQLLCSLSRNRRLNRALRQIFLLLLALPYGIEYFVYMQFKILYDVNTVTKGAGGVIASFLDQAIALLTSPGGILYLVLLLLPAVLYAVFGFRHDTARPFRGQRFVSALALTVALNLLAPVLVWAVPRYRSITSDMYNFETAVSKFGLMKGIQLDVFRMFGSDTDDFDIPGPIVVPTAPPQATEPSAPGDPSAPSEPAVSEPTEPIVYGKNSMYYDFAAMAEETSGTVSSINSYLATLTPTSQNAYTGMFRGKNLIFISAEAFTAEVIDPELTPTLYRLATKGIQFTDYYQPASGTTGGEFQNLFGMLPTEGGKSVRVATKHKVMTMATFLNMHGYIGQAFHNHSSTFYDRNITHEKLGYSEGFMGMGSGMEEYVSKNWPESDAEMFRGTIPLYIGQDKPFNLYYMSVSGHNGYTRGENAMTRKHWDAVKDLPYSEEVRGYLAAQLDLEEALTYLVQTLEASELADDTVICISTDHFPYGLDANASLGNMKLLSELYGYNVTTRMERDHNRLVLWSGCLEDSDPIVIDTPTSSLDILPTLCNLFGVPFDSRLMVGRDVFSDAPPLVFNLNYDWKTDLGEYNASTGVFTPVSGDVIIPEGYADAIMAIVKNKIRYCSRILSVDYFATLPEGIG